MVDQWHDAAAPDIGIRQICCCGGPGPARRSRPPTDARDGRCVRGPRAAQAGDGFRQLIGSSMLSIFLRSLVYNVLFYALLVFWILVAVPTFVLPPRFFIRVAKAWALSSIWLQRVVCNTRVEYRGVEKIPHGPLLV